MSFNKIIIVGNLGRDPEMRYTPQGTAVCSFSLASNERRRDRAGEPQDITTWFRVTVWGKQAETVSQYLHKGKSVYVEGRLHVEEWTDKEGKPRYTLEVNASDVRFIDSASDAAREGIPVRPPAARAEAPRSAAGAAAASRLAGGRLAPQSFEAEEEEDSVPF